MELSDFFRQHPTAPEGDLTRVRAALVCEQSLYEVAQKLELGKYLKLGRGEEARESYMRALLLGAPRAEALCALGDALLDGGQVEAAAFWYRAAMQAEKPERSGGFIL